jgi:sugar phosphate isomerase/epimerase
MVTPLTLARRYDYGRGRPSHCLRSDSHPLGLCVEVFLAEQLKACELLGHRTTELALQCSLEPSPFQAAAMLHRLGELSVIYAALCWESREGALSEEQLSKAIEQYARSFALMIKVHLGIPRYLQELIGAVYALPNMHVRQDQVIMRLAGAEMMNEPQTVLQKLKRLAGVP